MKRTLHGMLALIAVLFLNLPDLSAQVDRATLSGVVRDTGGGVVPGATVTVTNLATNIESHQVDHRDRLVSGRSTWCPDGIRSKSS